MIIGTAMFKRRVGGVYFAIITQAVALILTILIIGQQGYTGGVNGMTDLKTLLGWDIRAGQREVILYLSDVCAAVRLHRGLPVGSRPAKLGRCCWRCATRKTGFASPATTSRTSRSSPSAWPRSSPAIGGAMFTLQVGFMSPSLRGHRAVDRDGDLRGGGRAACRLVGAVYGTLLVNFGKTFFSESFPELWLFLMAALFIVCGDGFPEGAGRHVGRITSSRGATGCWRRASRKPAPRRCDRRRSGRRRRARRSEEIRSCAIGISPTISLLAVEDLTVSFDGFKAVDDLTLYIDENELRVIIGPNGAGKTTLLDLICGKTGDVGQHQVQGHGADEMHEHEIVRRASAASSRRRRSTRT